MILISNFTYLLFMLSCLVLSASSFYAIAKINGEEPIERHGVLFSIGLIILLYYRQSLVDVLASIPVYAALTVVFTYLAHDAIKEGKRYTKTATERAK